MGSTSDRITRNPSFMNCPRLRTMKSWNSPPSLRPELKHCLSAAGLALDPKMRTRYHEMILAWRLSTQVRFGADLQLAPIRDIRSRDSEIRSMGTVSIFFKRRDVPR